MRSCLFTLLFLGLNLFVIAQDKPKIVIGLVVDQMSNDYLYRFEKNFGEKGFKTLMNEGHYFPNTFYSYMRTSTGPGHATIYTGCNPSSHGIVENTWIDRETGKSVYCTNDESVMGLNGENEMAKSSPHYLMTSTITDMLSLSTNGISKIGGIALKDRSAVFPAGHSADLALWWDDKSGKWISDTYYTGMMPFWLTDFENDHPASNYLTYWTMEPNTSESEFYKKHNEFEEGLFSREESSFPYDLKQIAEKKGINILKSSPFGNTYTFDLAKRFIKEEQYGKDDVTDFLCVSFSATDYIGHRFGPYSAEIEDTYTKFDKDLASFLAFLDQSFGKENYLLFLTSDHGVVPNIDFLMHQKMPGSHYSYKTLKEELGQRLMEKYKTDSLIRLITDDQVYLNHKKINESKLKLDDVCRFIAETLNDQENILAALSSHDLMYKEYSEFPRHEMQQSFFKDRSGDVLFSWKAFMRSEDYIRGTGHGTPFIYDRNVPLLWYGQGISKGTSFENTDVTQIAATLADLLKIQRPPNCTSESLAGKLK